MANESPFLLFKVECPICKTINEFEVVRVGAYTEDGRDTDFCPMNIKWRFPRYQAYNPLVFFTGTCGNCFYSRELTNGYRDWKNDNTFRTYRLKDIKERHLEQLSTAESVVKPMGQAIDLSRFPNESAIVKLHLAIYDEHLADRCSNLDLGRFYLRIAWVFRDLEKGENPQLLFLRGMMGELDGKFGSLTQAVETVQKDTDEFERNVKSHFESEQLATDLKAQMIAFDSRYAEQIGGLNELTREFRKRLASLGDLMEEYKQVTLGTGDDSSGPTFGNFRSFAEFLAQMKKRWPKVVCNEREAMEQAVYHYKEAFASGRDISPGTQQIQASYLIAELSRRIGDHDGAREYFTSTIKTGQDFIYRHRQDRSRTVLARKILELAIEQGRTNLAQAEAG